MFQDTELATRLFALEGVEVAEVDAGDGAGRTAWVVTAGPGAAACPGCKTVSEHVKEYVTTRPADLRHGWGQIGVVWVKRRWECRWPSCPRTSFTESIAQVPPRCRVSTRLREHAAALVAEGGRTVAQAARECGLSWPVAQASPAWRHHIQIVAIDMCSIYASAVRRMLPHATLVVDLFHVVQLAVKMTGDVRRRVVRGKYGRRGRPGDAEYGTKTLLVRNLEHLSPARFAKVMDTLGADRHGQEILAAWIAKDKLRDVLNLRARVTGSAPCERDVHDRLFRFYDWCAQNDDIPELVTLARTISRWEDELVCAVLTGVTNARSESLNQIAKLEARMAYSFRNPANQRRRVRTACNRVRRSRATTIRRPLRVTGRKHDPG